MFKRFAAMTLAICCLFSMLPGRAVDEGNQPVRNVLGEQQMTTDESVPFGEDMPDAEPVPTELEAADVESAPVDREISLAEGESGAMGIAIDDGDDALPEGSDTSEAGDTNEYVGGTSEGEILLDSPVGMLGEEDSVSDMPESIYILMPAIYNEAGRDDSLFPIAVSTGQLAMIPGSTYDLKAVNEDGVSCAVIWAVQDASVAVVNETGRVTAIGLGETVITATAESGITAQCRVIVRLVPDEVSFNCDALNLGVGEKSNALRVITGDGDEYFGEYTLSSDKTKYVRVNADGTVTGVKAGSATITVVTENNHRDTVKVTVKKAPSKVTASPKSVTLGVNETAQLGYKLPSGTGGGVSYTSRNEAVAAVDEDTGVVTAKSPGTAKIQIKTFNGKTCTVTVKVVKAPSRIGLSAASMVMGVDQTQKLTATLDAGSAGKIMWESSDESVVLVDGGKLTAVAPGAAVVTASTYVEGLTASCRVEVKPAPRKVSLPESKIYIGVGQTFQLMPDVGDSSGGFTYSSSKKSYATVSASGLVKVKKKGSSTITVKTYNGKKTTVKVVVGKAPSKVSASPAVLGLYEKRILEYKLSSGSYGSVTFTSLNPEYVSIDNLTGEMYAAGVGTATVQIKTHNGKSCKVSVQVLEAPKTVTIAPDNLELQERETVQLVGAVNEGAASTLIWSSSDESVAAVTDGKVTAVGVGSATITAHSHIESVYAQCTVNVIPAPEKLAVSSEKVYLGIGDAVQLHVTGGEPEGDYTYSSSKKSYATVDAGGIVKGKKAGKSTITVTSADGQSAKVSVTVGKKPTKITANPGKMVLGLNETAVLGYKLPKGCYGGVTFTSRSPECVSVDPVTGAMTANAVGTATIDLKTYNGKKTTATVQVVNAPNSLSMSANVLEVGVGQKLNITASVNAGAASKLIWESFDPEIAAVENGAITGVAPGMAEIRVNTYVEDVYGICNVVVKPAPEEVTLPESKIYLGVGETLRLEPDVGDSVGGYTYSSSNKKYAKVSADGTVKGVKAGTAQITVKTYNGKKATVTVVVRKAPSKITPSATYVELGLGESFELGYTLPKNTNGTVTFESMDKAVLSVDSRTGLVTAVSVAEANVRLRTHNGKEAFCKVKVFPAPEWVKVGDASVEMGAGQTCRINATLSSGSRSSLRYTSSDESIAVVSEDGVITAVSRGMATVRVDTCNPDACAFVDVVVWDAPERVSLGVVGLDMNVDETYRLEPIIPEGSMTDFVYTSSNPALAEVSGDGVVTTRMQGEVFITAMAHNGKQASIKLNIFDPWYPEAISLTNEPEALFAGAEAYQLKYTLEPETAKPLLKWTSSNGKVATVDQNGLIKPLSYGYTTIKAVSQKNSAIEIKFTLAVQEKNRILAIPARTTQEDGIEENLEKIDAIRRSAIAEVDALRAGGVIKSSDATKRKSMINNIFRDYAFPWKTNTLQKYWRKANSEGGAKNFKTDRVYYGMPYTSGSSSNRAYNVSKALKEKRYTDSGNGYYLLNRKKLLNGSYVGNDCSGLVNAAIWGTSSSHTYDRTAEIATSKAYKTIKSFEKMRPGDLICLEYRHVVMFLYYANPEKTKIMVIENGGPEPGTNTVHCSVYDVSYYTKQGYKVRRLASLG